MNELMARAERRRRQQMTQVKGREESSWVSDCSTMA